MKDINRIRHDLKRISQAIKMLIDELDVLSNDINEGDNNETNG
jgi:archaellum component FlaC